MSSGGPLRSAVLNRGCGVVDPMSLSAVLGFLVSVSGSLATEAGKSLWDSAAVLTRQITGRPVPAPAGDAAMREVARILAEGARQDPAHARALSALLRGVPSAGVEYRTPRLLPASTRYFTDRRDPMRTFDRERSRKPDGTPRLLNVHGPSGIGVTTLVAHWGWRELAHFPDGQLYLDLRGESAGSTVASSTVLADFLRKLGVAAEALPPRTEDQVALYRTLVAERRLLIVLDRAHSVAQVRPLLSSAPDVLMIVTSRHPLAGLDAVQVPVGPLDDKDSVRLLTQLAGKQALTAARATLPSLLTRCAGSPWALRAAASSLLEQPPPPQIASGSQAGPRPGPASDPVRAVLDEVYPRLAPGLARAYRLLSLRDWPALSPALAAAILDLGEAESDTILADLAGRQLLTSVGDDRYTYGPAVRRHAEERAAREDSAEQRTDAVRRAVATLLRTAVLADLAALRGRWTIGPHHDRARGAGANPHPDAGSALAALEAESGNVLEAIRAAEQSGDAETVCYLCQALWPLQLKAGHLAAVLPALRTAVRMADASHLAGTPLAARMHTQLGLALNVLQLDEEAERNLRAAAEADKRSGHLRGQATAVESLGLLRLRQWSHAGAYELFEEAERILDGITEGVLGHADVPRARALLQRHKGRALRGLGRVDEARERLGTALRFFRAVPEPYNTARTLTDLADTHLDEGNRSAARPLVEEAITILEAEHARAHLTYLYALRERCLNEPG
jgi:tetratricopeptide (TPR) repeat protein